MKSVEEDLKAVLIIRNSLKISLWQINHFLAFFNQGKIYLWIMIGR